MKALVLGGSGLIGSAVARALEPTTQVTRFGRDELDTGDSAAVERIDLSGYDALVNCAGVTDEEVAASPERAVIRASVRTDRLIERAVLAGIRRFVYVSSAHVYGSLVGKLTEDCCPRPTGTYALSHYCAEQSLARHATGPDTAVLIIRPNAVFGMPPRPESFSRWTLIPYAFPRALSDTGVIRLKTSGTQRRNFVSADDIGRGVAHWLARPEREHVRRWNPIGPLTCSVRGFAEICCSVAREKTRTRARVAAPASNADAVPFEYSSQDPVHSPSDRIEPFVEELLAWLRVARGSRQAQ